jgi:anthranilate phosphoribosyltransferase
LDGSLDGEVATDIVLINAAAAIYVAGFASNLREAFNSAKESVRSNSAINKLNELRSATNKSK